MIVQACPNSCITTLENKILIVLIGTLYIGKVVEILEPYLGRRYAIHCVILFYCWILAFYYYCSFLIIIT